MKTIRVGQKNYSIVVFTPGEALRSTAPGAGEVITVLQVAVFEDARTLAGNGFAFCSSKAEFEPVKGVSIALQRALDQVKIPLTTTSPATRPLFRKLTAAEKAPFYELALGKSSEPNRKTRAEAPRKAPRPTSDGD